MMNFFNNFFNKKKLNILIGGLINSRYTYFILILIILIQFILVSIIFLQNKQNQYLVEQTSFRSATIENQQKQINEKINSLQSNLMRVSSQIMRMQTPTEEIK